MCSKSNCSWTSKSSYSYDVGLELVKLAGKVLQCDRASTGSEPKHRTFERTALERHLFAFFKRHLCDIGRLNVQGDGVYFSHSNRMLGGLAESFVQLELDKPFEHFELE